MGRRKSECEMATDDGTTKRSCEGVSSRGPTAGGEPMEEGQETADQVLWNQLSGEFHTQMSLPKHIVPAQRKRCLRCLAGEGGHINHVLQ